MTVFERWWIWRVRAACVLALARRGGDALVGDACTEASWYADMMHPWDGRGCEPAARVYAWLSILAARGTLAEGRYSLDHRQHQH
ncbi:MULTISPECIES: hypothetical protein [Pseudonocardia]|uniref:Uncharacterized protein n=1 Tax=Pseudonocardia autotrophica TaxID=2074 RepID=A0A1Y2MIR5_PSEAH|nr:MULTISPECIES: hypothetical protein [Pseudonocardia]OSY35143.1 hypothetical protein BG845_06300 [Pseudonocardia autotrophica]TDN72125.1 hypothetical protein C8E95_1174 [Pseudonocardia autotrophica]